MDIHTPSHLHLIYDDRIVPLDPRLGTAGQADVSVHLEAVGAQHLRISMDATATPVRGLHLRWSQPARPGALWLSDAWGRAEGEHGWRALDPERALPWYVLWHQDDGTHGLGLATDAACIGSFQSDPEGLSLFLDTRNGGSGVLLGGRRLHLATLVYHPPQAGENPWRAARGLAQALVRETPRQPTAPIYGCNNWYYAYGDIDRDGVLADAERTANWAGDAANRPFMLIDDGWQVAHCDARYNGGPWHAHNANFDDMSALAAGMRERGVRPGIWYRPLVTLEGRLERFQSQHGLPPSYAASGYSLDPTFPEVQERLRADAGRLAQWGFDLIKHDFTTVDLLGTWANHGGAMAQPHAAWHFHDRSRTNAELLRQLYHLISDAAEGAIIIGCQSIGHLGVGAIDLQRIGGDVDGRGWQRTRRMGINSLAFRLHQHGVFYQVDADCAPVTPTLPWREAEQWLDLLARSGTPLFVSADPRALGPEQDRAIRKALRHAAQAHAPAEALDWTETRAPRHWHFDDGPHSYRWMPHMGNPPVGLLPGDAARLLHDATGA